MSGSELLSDNCVDHSFPPIVDCRKTTNNNCKSGITCIITGIKKNIGMGSIIKSRRENWRKQCKQRRVTKASWGGLG